MPMLRVKKGYFSKSYREVILGMNGDIQYRFRISELFGGEIGHIRVTDKYGSDIDIDKDGVEYITLGEDDEGAPIPVLKLWLRVHRKIAEPLYKAWAESHTWEEVKVEKHYFRLSDKKEVTAAEALGLR